MTNKDAKTAFNEGMLAVRTNDAMLAQNGECFPQNGVSKIAPNLHYCRRTHCKRNADMIDFKKLEIWFVTGSQHLYGPKALEKVRANSHEIAAALDACGIIPAKVILKPTVTSPETATAICQEANKSPACSGVITWCHTFSPSKMWINGLKLLNRPLLHLHTQHNRELPWSSIDMDFMNLNQAAHGDREHGYIMSRMRMHRKVVAGHWKDRSVQERIGNWSRAAMAWHDWQGAKFCRFGDNMREVAVTEGDKVAAQIKFGFSVNGYGVGDLVEFINTVTEKEVDELTAQYDANYTVATKLRKGAGMRHALRQAAQIELGLRTFLTVGNFKGFTDTFEDLHGLPQLPGISAQRLMADGYGFGAEGD
jgi:L-arabinose isomerase